MPLTQRERAMRDRVESVIRLMEPGLDLVLALGDRMSRLLERDDAWEPPRSAGMPQRVPPSEARE
jgi:hypothetical protein